MGNKEVSVLFPSRAMHDSTKFIDLLGVNWVLEEKKKKKKTSLMKTLVQQVDLRRAPNESNPLEKETMERK